MGEVTGVNAADKYVLVNGVDGGGVRLSYDYLILATGATHNYFGHNEFEKYAPGLKGLADAVAIRNKILRAFEQAEAEEDPSKQCDLLTFVLVGAGPTGCEPAGAIADLCRITLRAKFRRINPASARVVLVDAGRRVLGSFADRLSTAVKNRLESLGVELRLGHRVDRIDEAGVVVAGERINSKTVIWTAGVTPSPAAKWLNTEADGSGRVRVEQNLSVSGHSHIFVIGDAASLEQDGRPLPGVAQVAMQQGRYVSRLIHRCITGKSPLKPFRYFDKGNMAVVGKSFAILQSGKLCGSGFPAWFVWATVHLQFLAQSNLRVSVFLQWVWTYITGQRGSVLIVNHLSGTPTKATSEADENDRELITR